LVTEFRFTPELLQLKQMPPSDVSINRWAKIKVALLTIACLLVGGVAGYIISSKNLSPALIPTESPNSIKVGLPQVSTTALSGEVLHDLGGGYFENVSSVYYTADPTAYPAAPIAGADVATFQEVPMGDSYGPPFYFKDSSHIYAFGEPIAGADPTTFKILGAVPQPASWGDLYAADKNHVYFFDKIVPGADPKTFVLLPQAQSCADSPYEAKDQSHYYFQNSQVCK